MVREVIFRFFFPSDYFMSLGQHSRYRSRRGSMRNINVYLYICFACILTITARAPDVILISLSPILWRIPEKGSVYNWVKASRLVALGLIHQRLRNILGSLWPPYWYIFFSPRPPPARSSPTPWRCTWPDTCWTCPCSRRCSGWVQSPRLATAG